MKVLVPIREMMNLERFDKPIDAFQTGEHGGNDHHGAAIRSDAAGVIQSGKQARLDQKHGEPVHQRHGQLTGAKQKNERGSDEFPSVHSKRPRLLQKSERSEDGEEKNPARIKRQRATVNASSE